MSKHFMFLIKYAEIAIKGKNRHLFEDALCKQIRHAVKNYGITGRVEKQPGRIYLETEDSETYDDDRVCEAPAFDSRTSPSYSSMWIEV